MKQNNLDLVRNFALHLLKECGYEDSWNIEKIKSFITEKFDVKWCDAEYPGQPKYGSSFKPYNAKVTEYRIYAKNNEKLIEAVMWEITKGKWRKENN